MVGRRHSVTADSSCGERDTVTVPGDLTELQQRVGLPLKALGHREVIVLSGYVLVKVAVGAPSEAVRPLQRKRGGR